MQEAINRSALLPKVAAKANCSSPEIDEYLEKSGEIRPSCEG
jgi:hypothetical protein